MWLDGALVLYRSFYRSELAFACALASEGPDRVIQGECREYWVVSPADAERLQRAGYQIVEESAVGVWSTEGPSTDLSTSRSASVHPATDDDTATHRDHQEAYGVRQSRIPDVESPSLNQSGEPK